MNQYPKLFLTACLALPFSSVASPLIVVADQGGASALPYYQDLIPEPTGQEAMQQNMGVQGAGAFPVQSTQLTPGSVQGRVINAPGLQPMFLVGDDELSKTWLSQHREHLKQIQAVGIVINVANAERFAEVSRWAADLKLVPAPANELAGRLSIRHYPVLITATAIQQ
ncbi:hypothetical protein EY04_23960 [Pseudomonas chlororaphis]|uniref:integrating conjugative element protein n=1 Tax=Pseudomonas chlororaphis TaxID=587753 RepID=UPI0004AC0767|nr:integrating conjugative element protein [Pseudomonas chlororaphis]AIC21855.1 hypothetical protein EY04_23960 [Pseudomonas chlororaphis]